MNNRKPQYVVLIFGLSLTFSLVFSNCTAKGRKIEKPSPVYLPDEPDSVAEWQRSQDKNATYWTKEDVRYVDSDGDGKVDTKEFALKSGDKYVFAADVGELWADTDKDGNFDTIFELSFGGGKKIGTINIPVPKTE